MNHMKDSMMLYGVTLGERRKKRSKAAFISYVKERYEQLGYPVSLDSIRTKYMSLNNIYAGDMEKADIIIAASYDTASKVFLPGYRYYPFHRSKTISQERWNLLVTFLAALLLIAVLGFCIFQYSGYSGTARVITGLLAILLTGMILKWFTGFSNRFNFNRNSASLAVMEEVASGLNGSERTAFAFLDNTADSYDGMKKMFEHSFQARAVIILDCISAGELLVAGHGSECQEEAGQLLANLHTGEMIDKCYSPEKKQQNALNLCGKMIYLTSGKIRKGDLVVEGTRSRKDIRVNMERLERIAEMLKKYADQAGERQVHL